MTTTTDSAPTPPVWPAVAHAGLPPAWWPLLADTVLTGADLARIAAALAAARAPSTRTTYGHA